MVNIRRMSAAAEERRTGVFSSCHNSRRHLNSGPLFSQYQKRDWRCSTLESAMPLTILTFPYLCLPSAKVTCPLNRRTCSGSKIFKLNDQHAYLEFAGDDSLIVGDLVCCGISHPCTAFDKWRLLPLVDDGYNVIDLYHTLF